MSKSIEKRASLGFIVILCGLLITKHKIYVTIDFDSTKSKNMECAAPTYFWYIFDINKTILLMLFKCVVQKKYFYQVICNRIDLFGKV